MEFIAETIRGKYPEIDSSRHIWKNLINAEQEYGQGWNDLVIDLVRKIEKIYDKRNSDPSDFCIHQTKESMGL